MNIFKVFTVHASWIYIFIVFAWIWFSITNVYTKISQRNRPFIQVWIFFSCNEKKTLQKSSYFAVSYTVILNIIWITVYIHSLIHTQVANLVLYYAMNMLLYKAFLAFVKYFSKIQLVIWDKTHRQTIYTEPGSSIYFCCFFSHDFFVFVWLKTVSNTFGQYCNLFSLTGPKVPSLFNFLRPTVTKW